MTDIIFDWIEHEEQRLREKIGLIPSENHTSSRVASVLSSGLSSKYAEGYPDRRYYEGNQYIDLIEKEAQDRLKSLFKVPYVNVQPYSGSPANAAIQMALLSPGDTLMGLALSSGGHLTHGHPQISFSGTYFRTVQYAVDSSGVINIDDVRSLALEAQPRMIIVGTTCYPFQLDYLAFREIADAVDAWLVADISHITGLILGGEHPSPVPYAHVVMSTTHKTFRGPRGAMILVTAEGLKKDVNLGKKIDSAVFPGLQGGPHNATTAAIALAAAEASQPSFREYAVQMRKNARVLATTLQQLGLSIVGGGTQTHLVHIDLSPLGYGLGTQVAFALDVAGIYANKNTIPYEPCSPFYPSGLRLGTPLVTTRGMKEREMKLIAAWIMQVVDHVRMYELPKDKELRAEFVKKFKANMEQDVYLQNIAQQVKELAVTFPLFAW